MRVNTMSPPRTDALCVTGRSPWSHPWLYRCCMSMHTETADIGRARSGPRTRAGYFFHIYRSVPATVSFAATLRVPFLTERAFSTQPYRNDFQITLIVVAAVNLGMVGTVSVVLDVFVIVFLLTASVSLFVLAPLAVISIVVERFESR